MRIHLGKLTAGFFLLTLWVSAAGIQEIIRRPFERWTLQESIQVLTDSPWAKESTFTQVIEGVGSGLRGDKEILSTFYTRILSARPVRQALARVEQINHGFDQMDGRQQTEFRALLEPGLRAPMRHFIVVAVTFRSNDRERENEIRRFFETQTADTLRNQAFLSTSRSARVPLRAYHPPRGDGLGARFIFPRFQEGVEVFADADTLLFQLEIPQLDTPLTVGFPLDQMAIGGELVL